MNTATPNLASLFALVFGGYASAEEAALAHGSENDVDSYVLGCMPNPDADAIALEFLERVATATLPLVRAHGRWIFPGECALFDKLMAELDPLGVTRVVFPDYNDPVPGSQGVVQELLDQLSEVVSAELDPSVQTTWMRCSPGLPAYVQDLERRLRASETIRYAEKAILLEEVHSHTATRQVLSKLRCEANHYRSTGLGAEHLARAEDVAVQLLIQHRR